MRRLCLFVLLAALPFPLRAADAPAKTDGDLYVLGVALNQAPDKNAGETIDSWDWCPEEIEKLFKERAAAFHRKVESRLVLGDKATHQGILDGLAWLHDKAHKNDLVVMYIGCHGFTDPDEGWGVDAADGQTLWGHEVKAELGKLPCPVIILIETCTSGGFAHRHKDDPPVPANVTALCACSGKQSASNELDIAVAEALYGRADFNHDGVVDLDELIRYVKLRYREWQPEPKPNDEHVTPVIVKSDALPGSVPLTQPARELAAVVHDGQWYGALVEKHDGDQYQVHLLGWNSRPGAYYVVSSAPREEVCLPSDGRPLLVKQEGVWYPARLLGREGDDYKIHYIDYQEDEVVTKDRVQYPFVGDPDAAAAAAAAAPPPAEAASGAGTWEQVGPAGEWKATLAGAVLDGKLYTVEDNGGLYVTNPKDGGWTQIGKADFGDARFLFAAGDRLVTINKDGSLFKVDPKDGRRRRLGDEGAWKATVAGAVLDGRLYTTEDGGGLYATDLDSGQWKQVGKADFGDARFLLAAGDHLCVVDRGGNLFNVSPKDGKRRRVGAAGAWQATITGAVLNGKLYTAETNGGFYETNLGTGAWTQLGKAEFADTVFLFGAGDHVYTIEKSGSLYRVHVK